MATFEFFQAAGLSYEEVVRLAEQEVRRADSPLIATIESELAEMLGATVTKNTRDALSKRVRRVYVPYTVDQAKLYELTMDYPQWDIHFTMVENTAAPLARAVFQLTIENLFDMTGPDKAELVAFGCTLNPLVIRNRKWAHVCMPLADSTAYRTAILDDRAMVSIFSAAKKAGRVVPLAAQYETGQMKTMCCSRPAECTFQARMGFMMLHRTPTNFRQVCAFMSAHGCEVLVFAVPWNKAMETGIDGAFPELDAQVIHSSDYIDLAYKNAQDLDTRFARSGYLELITRTSLVIGDKIFTKEHVDYVRGMAYYRVIATEHKFNDPPPVYRSWLNPAYREYYSVKAFVPKSGNLDFRHPNSYEELLFDVEQSLLDPLLSFGLALDTKEMVPIAYRRKLRSLTSGVLLHSTVVRPPKQLEVPEYKALATVAFTHVFMSRYITGETVKQLLSQVKRRFQLQNSGAIRVFVASVARLAYVAYDSTIDTFLTKLNQYWRFLSKTNVPVGSFAQTVGFKAYTGDQPNPWTKSTYADALLHRRPTGFYPHLPGAAEVSFLYAKHIVPRHATFEPVLTSVDQSQLEQELADAMGGWDDSTAVVTESVASREYVESELVSSLARSVVADFGMHVSRRDEDLQAVVPLRKKYPPPVVHAGKSDAVVHDLMVALEGFFPGSTVMDTSQYQGDINYGPMEITARAVKLAIDVSKLSPLRPEYVYEPVVKAHIEPNTRNTLQNVVNTVVKRNLNTPDFKDPASIAQVWYRTWNAMLKVYYVPGAEQALDALSYIGPTFENVREYVSRIPDDKKARLLKEDFSLADLDMVHNEMMLKAKKKPLLSQEYAEASKPGQSIIYDQTGKRVAVFSPLIAEKVRRQTAVLRSNVLVMQRKSPSDMNEFFCRFDHRVNVAGVRRKYLEIDSSMFDKAQGMMAKSMHWNLLSMFKVLPELVSMIRAAGSALDAASIQAGVRMMTPPERETGQFDTLDGNTDVTLAMLATFLLSIIGIVEFIAVMGDDCTIAIRGDADLSTLEADVARIFNVSVKYILSDYGYFCSGFIVHLQDGLSRWVPDPAKRLLDYCIMSNKEETDVHDQFQSHHDLCKGLEDVVVQAFLAVAMPVRYRHVSSKIDAVVVGIGCRVIVTVSDSFRLYQSLRSSVLKKRAF